MDYTMFKALLKKQLMETNTWLLINRKSGKRRKLPGIIMLVLIYLALFATLGVVFFFTAQSLCVPFHEMGFDWLFYAIMGLISIMLGIFGSVFNTYASLYKAKDNDMLLAMPIKPIYIICARLFGVWMWSLIYEAIVFVPALLAYSIFADSRPLTVISGITVMIVISMFILTLSCILGYAVAKISSKLKNKSFATVAVSLLFIIVYYYVYFRANEILTSITANAELIESKLGKIYPLYIMGKAACGDLLSLLIFTLMIVAVFAAVYYVLNRSFFALARAAALSDTKKHTAAKRKLKPMSLDSALLFKERKRFTTCPIYMLNCALGALFMPALGIFLLIKAQTINEMLALVDSKPLAVLIAAAAICMVTSMIDITAPSISLEGKNIWLAQSLPIPSGRLLLAKLRLHVTIAAPCVIFCSVCAAIVLECNLPEVIVLILLPLVYAVFTGAFGLIMNLAAPNLTWKNETVPVKQSLSVTVTLLGGMFFAPLLGIPYLFLGDLIHPLVYAAICCTLLVLALALMLWWIVAKGSRKFATL